MIKIITVDSEQKFTLPSNTQIHWSRLRVSKRKHFFMMHTGKLCSPWLQDVVDAKSLCQFRYRLDKLKDWIYTDTAVSSRNSWHQKSLETMGEFVLCVSVLFTLSHLVTCCWPVLKFVLDRWSLAPVHALPWCSKIIRRTFIICISKS